jgi:epsilon-lactone hydrolase
MGPGFTLVGGPSISMRLATWVLRRRGKALAPERLQEVTAELQARPYPQPARLPPSLLKSCEVREETVAGYSVITVTPRNSRSRQHVIYTHGGAYVLNVLKEHWQIVEGVIRRTGATFTVPIYPLAPEHEHGRAYDQLEAVYRSLCSTVGPADITLMGDSAGGCLALGQAICCRDAGIALPARVVLLAPWLDITLSNPQARLLEPRDPMLGVDALIYCGKLWAGAADPRQSQLSPIYGDLAGLPPIDVYQGSCDIMSADTRVLHERVCAAGGSIRTYEYAGAFHVFVAATFTAEAKDALKRIAAALLGPSTGAVH